MRKILAVGLVVALLLPLLTIGQGQPTDTLGRVKARGNLICGVNNGVPGFGFLDERTGTFSGFDVDYCKTLATAIFNDPAKVTYRPLTAAARFTALAAGEVDVLIRNTTRTFSRDVELKLNFAPVTFYDGQGFMVRKTSRINTLRDLNGATVCVLQGTTTEQNLADMARRLGITIRPLVFTDVSARDKAYDEGRCDAMTADASGLAGARVKLSKPDDHKILAELISKEPLAPVVRHGDDAWYDLVTWTVYCTIEAEELGVNSKNVTAQRGSADPNVRRLLGVEGDFGKKLGLDSNDWCGNIIAKVGNYGEIYERNIKPLALERVVDGKPSPNALWTDGGLIYGIPFR
ncbi:amino acid ABC transporter substrate-binding protein [Candidatus Acetothermia bacterium]|jgi:general L-amino acid transport system substrate-binding protein|nr:amino acid ABC transporter substrate-binding protein [Candidatus Acetothermia bacterium]MCI2432464.1 amino acid ABC transporter substrate-binding protein [Candidatus Acetothermia bacterium]MCI2437102.1 amino acid ABC transporter substrate-binding protein [Candidatus Acetothermia bacterium]